MLFKFKIRETEKKENYPKAMDQEIISFIFLGCKLAKELEQNLPNSANQPSVLVRSCDEIIRVFANTRERLHALERETGIESYVQVVVQGEGSHHHHHGLPPPMQAEMGGGDGGVQAWLRISQAMDMVVHAQGGHHHRLLESSRMGRLEAITEHELGGGNVDVLPMEVADSGRGSSLQRPRRSEADRRTMRVPAPRMGNMEVPTEDGYTWRKYGQKYILGSRFPRGYYRCIHKKLYNCPAKKQVQRLDNDPYTIEVTYRGNHTCTMSSTAPSVSPPPITAQSPPPNSVSLAHNWLSMDFNVSGEGTSSSTVSNIDMQMYRDHLDLGGPSPSWSSGAGAGPSTTQYVDYQGLADLAAVMFNSGSSSNNSMELIFSTMEEDKWEGGDKKN